VNAATVIRLPRLTMVNAATEIRLQQLTMMSAATEIRLQQLNAESGLMFQKFAANPGDSRPAEPLAAQQARIERCAEEWALRNGYEFETKEDLDKCVQFVLSCT
jgi:hypothetical protein